MGHRNSKQTSEAIKKLSSLELQNIKAVFNELSTENKDGTREIPEPNLATRRVFAERFSLPGLIGERLFHSFDRDNNGTINLEEFVSGVALCLHGSAHAKCELLFRMFNFSDEEENAVTEDELKTVLLSSLQSAHTILDTVQDGGVVELSENEKPLVETVAEIVEDAFKTCDKSKNGKLSAKEFSSWLHKNPKIMDNVFGWQCPKPELGQWANETEPQEEAKKGSNKSLQDLFGGTQSNQDLSGEQFFDSLGVSTEAIHIKNNEEQQKPEKSDNNLVAECTSNTNLINNDTLAGQVNNAIPEVQESPSLPQTVLPYSEPCLPDINSKESGYGHFNQYAALWIPTEETMSFLQAVQNGTVKPENIKLPNMAIPCLAIDAPQVDPVKELIAKFLTGQDDLRSSIPTENTVPCNEVGLKQLLRAECWRAALNLTGKLLEKRGLNASHDTHTPESLEIWFCRVALLFQLKMFNIAEVELQAFGNLDSAKLYYEFHPDLYPGQKGSMVPFAFRVLNALLPQHTGRPKESQDKLFYIHSVCQQILKSLQENDKKADEQDEDMDERQKGIKLWEKRLLSVLYCIGNTFISLKEYGLAIAVFKQISKKDLDNTRALLSGIGRISLQSGDIEKAQCYFKSVEDMISAENNSHPDVLINRGLTALTLDAYEEAYKHFLAAKNIDPGNSVAINNAAVSLLFQGRLKEALELLEDVVFKRPEINLHEGILFNICTMYELETSHHIQKKQKLLELIAKYKGDGFNVSCLKFP